MGFCRRFLVTVTWFTISLTSLTLCVGPVLADSQGAPLPRGIYRITSQVTGISYHLLITETNSDLFPGQAGYLMEITTPTPEPISTLSIAFWHGHWDANNSHFAAVGTGRRHNSHVHVYFDQELKISGFFKSTNPHYYRRTGLPVGSPIPYEGVLDPQERTLIEKSQAKSLLNSARPHSEIQGYFRNANPHHHFRGLTLIHDRIGGQDFWTATLVQDGTETPLVGLPDTNGLIRLVRAPSSTPYDLSAFTIAVLPNHRSTNVMEIHGLYIVPRNGTIEALRFIADRAPSARR